MKYQLVTSIMPKSIEEFSIQVNKCVTPLVEHRIDGFSDFDNFNIKYKEYNKEFIATIRPTSLGGNYKGTINEKLSLLSVCMRNGISFIDIELELDNEIINKIITQAQSKEVKVILSTHNFSETPKLDSLREIYRNMLTYQPDIIKIVSTANTKEDGERMITIQRESTIPTISFAMGIKGSFTRILALEEGAPFMYVSLEGNNTAEGQFSFQEMNEKLQFRKNN